VDFCGADELRIHRDVLLPVEACVAKGNLAELTHAVRLGGRGQVVVWGGLLHHQPHRPDVVASEAPVSPSLEVPHRQLLLKAELDPRDAVRDLAGHELQSATWRLVT